MGFFLLLNLMHHLLFSADETENVSFTCIHEKEREGGHVFYHVHKHTYVHVCSCICTCVHTFSSLQCEVTAGSFIFHGRKAQQECITINHCLSFLYPVMVNRPFVLSDIVL